MTLPGNATGLRVPGWAVAAVTIALALIAFGLALGQRVQAQVGQVDILDYRLCRIERALQIEPWKTCARQEGTR